MITLASCGGLFIAAAVVGYTLNWLFSPTFRQTETEDAARTGVTFHFAAWLGVLVVAFCVIVLFLLAVDGMIPTSP